MSDTTFNEALKHRIEGGPVYALVETKDGTGAWKEKENILPTDKPINGWLARLAYVLRVLKR